MKSKETFDEPSSSSMRKSADAVQLSETSPAVPTAMQTTQSAAITLPPDHLQSRDEIQMCFNKITLDRTLTDQDRRRIQDHMEHVERFGLLVYPENGEEVVNG
jgi:hypothetical protein